MSVSSLHMSAAIGKARQSTPQAPPKLRSWTVDYSPRRHSAKFVFANLSTQKVDIIRNEMMSHDGVISIAVEGHVLQVRAHGGKVKAHEIKNRITRIVNSL